MKLLRINNNLFQSGSFWTNKESMTLHLIHNGYELEEIENAMTALIQKNHDIAYFGICKTFMFTCNEEGSINGSLH